MIRSQHWTFTRKKIIEALRTGTKDWAGLPPVDRASSFNGGVCRPVLLLEDGRITAQGTHTELMKLPQYRRLVRVQDGVTAHVSVAKF